MRGVLLFIAVVGISACTPTTVVVKEPVEVRIPIRMPCEVKPVEKPKFEMDRPDLVNQGIFKKGLAALVEIEQRKDYEALLEAVISECTKPTNP